MKKLILTLLGCSLLVASLTAQRSWTHQEIMKEILKEKLRKPVQVDEAIKAYEEERNSLHFKKTRATEKKITSATSSAVEEGEAHIAMDPNNNNRMALSYMNQSQGAGGLTFPIYTSNDGGNNWSLSSFNALSYLAADFGNGTQVLGGGDPIFSYDKNGKLFFSWIYLFLKPNIFDTAYANMYWASSTDNGTTWSLEPGNSHFIGKTAIDLFTSQSYANYDGFYDRQWFAHDLTNGPNANALYCSFLYIPNVVEPMSVGGTYVRKKDGNSSTFSATKKQVFSGTSQFANVVVDKGGKLHVTYADIDANKVYHSVSSDGGATFSSGHLIYSGTNLFGSQGNGYIHDRENSAVNLAVDGGNNLHVVWTDFPVNPGSTYKSYYSRSVDGGSTWSTPTEILFNGKKALMPVVCASGNMVTIGGYGVDASKVSDYYIMTSSNWGFNFWNAQKISTQTTNFGASSNTGKWFGDYFNSVRNATKVYNIWSDGRGTSGTKMYVSITTEPVGVQEITPINATFVIKQIFPNPARDILNIEVEGKESNEFEASLVTMDGKIVSTSTHAINQGLTKLELSLSNLSAGNYLLKVVSKDGYQYSRLFTKQ